MGLDAPWHWIVLALIVVALFGYKRMPEMARSVARSLRIFKTEIKGLHDDEPATTPVVPVSPVGAADVVAPVAGVPTQPGAGATVDPIG